MPLIDRETLRDLYGKTVLSGDTVKVNRRSNRTGMVFDFFGYVCELRQSDVEGRLEALVQPHGDREAHWVGGQLIEALTPVPECLEGVLAEW